SSWFDLQRRAQPSAALTFARVFDCSTDDIFARVGERRERHSLCCPPSRGEPAILRYSANCARLLVIERCVPHTSSEYECFLSIENVDRCGVTTSKLPQATCDIATLFSPAFRSKVDN